MQFISLKNGLLCNGDSSNFMVQGVEGSFNGELFGKYRAAQALGKTPATIYRWIDKGILPAPVIIKFGDSSSNRYYCVDELKLIAKVISKYENEYLYLGGASPAIQEVATVIAAYRDKVFYS